MEQVEYATHLAKCNDEATSVLKALYSLHLALSPDPNGVGLVAGTPSSAISSPSLSNLASPVTPSASSPIATLSRASSPQQQQGRPLSTASASLSMAASQSGGNPYRIAILADPAYAAVMKQVLKKFPDISKDLVKVAGFKQVQADLPRLSAELQPFYETLVSVTEFSPRCLQSLQYIRLFRGLHVMHHTLFTTLYLDVLANYVAIQLLFARIVSKRALIAAHHLTYNLTSGQTEPRLLKLLQHLEAWQKPFATLQEIFLPISGNIASLLMTYHDPYLKILTAAPETLRKESLLSIAGGSVKNIVVDDQVALLKMTFLALSKPTYRRCGRCLF